MEIKDWFTALAVIAFAGFCGYQWWPIKTSKFSCAGVISTSNEFDSAEQNLIFELTEYPWWTLWSTSDGWVRAARPSWFNIYHPYIKKHGENYQIRAAEQGEYQGDFSTFTYRLELYFGDDRFNGACNTMSLGTI